ncbi:MAG: flippase [Chloroflexi bacterium]|nr:flippase [Chloroflexota bacterium]
MRLIAQNLTALLGSQVATWMIGLVMVVFVPHYLGAERFGDLSFALYYVGFFALIVGMGTNRFLTKEIARDPARLASYALNTLLLKIPLALVASVSAVLVALVLGKDDQALRLIAVACVAMIVSALNATVVSALQGIEEMRWPAFWGSVERYLTVLGTIVVITRQFGLPAIVLVQGAASTVSLLANGTQLLRSRRAAVRLKVSHWPMLLRGGFPFLLADTALMVYGSIDIPMLSFMTSNVVVGWYVLAYRLAGLPIFLPVLVMTAFYPALSVQAVADPARFARLANQALRLVGYSCIPMAAGMILVAHSILVALRYPPEFASAVPLIRILSLHIPIVGMTTLLGAAIAANDRQSRYVTISCLAAIINPLLNLLAIPLAANRLGDGAVGAAVVTVATEAVMLAGAIALRPAGVLDRPTVRFLWRCVLACLPMAGVVLLAATLPLAMQVLAGVATYGAASLLLKIASPQDIHRLLYLALRSRGPAEAPEAV